MTKPRQNGKRRRLSDAQLEEMRTMRERGRGAQFIADHFTKQGTPISAGAISWQCLRIGADTLPRLRQTAKSRPESFTRNGHVVRTYSADEDALLRELDAQGETMAEMARRLGRKSNSIKGRLLTLARQEARAAGD